MDDREGDDENTPRESLQADGVDVSVQFENSDIIDISHEFIRTYIRHIDQKASILLTVLIAILGLFGNALRTGQLVLDTWEIVWGGAAVFFAVLSLTLATWSVYPKANKPSEGDDPGYLYWERILLFNDEDEVADKIKDLPPEESLQVLSKDLYYIAEIARNKYDNLRRALVLIFLSSVFATPAVFYRIIQESDQFTRIEINSTIRDSAEVISVTATFVVWSVIILTIIISEKKDKFGSVEYIKKFFN